MVAKLTERQFMSQVLQLARLYGWRAAHFRPAMNRRGQWQTAVQADGAGFPDLLLLRGGTQLAVELKVGRNNCSLEQEDWLLAFRAAGVRVEVWRPEQWTEIEKTLEEA